MIKLKRLKAYKECDIVILRKIPMPYLFTAKNTVDLVPAFVSNATADDTKRHHAGNFAFDLVPHKIAEPKRNIEQAGSDLRHEGSAMNAHHDSSNLTRS